MALPKDQVDIHLRILKPDKAREFIKNVDWGVLEPPRYIVFGIDDRIDLTDMDGEQAVFAAQDILANVVIPAAQRELQYERNTH